jgi:hypothetical protein
MTSVSAALLVLALAPAAGAAPGLRVWGGAALALDPAFAAAAAGTDWFFSDTTAIGICAAQTIAGAGDRSAAESGYGFVSLVGRLRLTAPRGLAAEILTGAGMARIRFGAPAAARNPAHTSELLSVALRWGR